MKVLIISMDTVGEGLAFALRCQGAGHAVRIYVNPDGNPTIATGFPGVQRISEWLTSVRWADIIIPTGNHDFMPALERIRKQGKRVFGPSVASAKLEINRSAGMDFLKAHGIEVPTFKTFTSLSAAEAHVRKTGERFVFKTLGDEDDKSLSYCGKNAADMVAWLQRKQRSGLKLKGPCMLQEFIDGTEFAVSGWMGRDGWVGEWNENFEHKKTHSGDTGPNCGEAGTVLKYVPASKLADEVLRPLEADLVKMGHLGDIDVNCIIDKAGKAWPLEFTCRLGWPAFNIMCALHNGDPVQWMADACDGKNTLKVSPRVAVGVVVAQPDFPYSERDMADTDGVPIYGVTDENRRMLWPQSVKRMAQPVMANNEVQEAPTWTTAGDYILVVTGLGRTVKIAAERAYATVKQLQVADMIYRNDIGKKLEDQLPQLHALGYAREFTYQGGMADLTLAAVG